MKSFGLFAACSAALLAMFGCGQQHSSQNEMASADSPAIISSSAAQMNKDSARKFVRTSDIKFRVKDVTKATYQIEDVTRSFGGFVTYTHLESLADEKVITKISSDSAVESIKYSVQNNMTLRVPNHKLDSTLKAIASLVDYLDYRTIKADDVALQIKSNQKTQLRSTVAMQRVRQATAKKGNKPGETIAAEEIGTYSGKEADDAAIANMALLDQVNYSTVSLALYQRSETKTWVIANDDASSAYRAGLGIRMWDAIKGGWYMLQEFIVFIVQLWFLFVIAIIGYFVYKRVKSGKLSLKS